MVNQRNPLSEINLNTVVALFSGSVTNWGQLTEWDEPVVLVSSEVGRATLDLFEEYAQLHHPARNPGSRGHIARNALEFGANIEALMLVGGLPGAIGYVSLGTASEFAAQGMPIKILTLDGVRPERATVVSGRYPIRRELNFVYRSRQGATADFLDLVISAEGQRILAQEGFIPAQ